MPVKWDAVKDQFLLLQLIKGSKWTKADRKKLIDEWPTSLGEKPTDRAVQEHILKLQTTVPAGKSVKTAGIKSEGGDEPMTPPGTEIKPTAGRTRAGGATTKTTSSRGKKRPRAIEDSDDDLETPTRPRPAQAMRMEQHEGEVAAGAGATADTFQNQHPQHPFQLAPREGRARAAKGAGKSYREAANWEGDSDVSSFVFDFDDDDDEEFGDDDGQE